MDPKFEKQKLKELKKMKKKDLKEMAENLASEHKTVVAKYKTVEASKNALETALFSAIDAKDNTTAEVIKSKMSVLKEELERLSKREKALAEELELASRAYKNDFEGKSSAWMTAGAWVVGIGTAALSGIGLHLSHKSFDKGEMVDKGTKSLGERLSGLMSFMQFRR